MSKLVYVLSAANGPTRESDGLALCVEGDEELLLRPPSWGPPASHPSWRRTPRVAWVRGQGFSSPPSHRVNGRCRDYTRQGWSWGAWPCGELLLSPALQGSVSSTSQMGSPSDSLILHFEISEGWAVMTGGWDPRLTDAVEPAPLDGGLWVSTPFISYKGE